MRRRPDGGDEREGSEAGCERQGPYRSESADARPSAEAAARRAGATGRERCQQREPRERKQQGSSLHRSPAPREHANRDPGFGRNQQPPGCSPRGGAAEAVRAQRGTALPPGCELGRGGAEQERAKHPVEDVGERHGQHDNERLRRGRDKLT